MFTAIHDFVFYAPPGLVFTGTFAYFLALYFIFALGSHYLLIPLATRMGYGVRVNSKASPPGQIWREIINSLISIFVFGCYGLLVIALTREGLVAMNFSSSTLKIIADLSIFTLWNEVHFFGMHRLLHWRPLYRWSHREHHRSVVPTSFATYSFHYFESILLGSVMPLILIIYPLNALVLVLFPIVSIALNTIGHMNYEFYTMNPACPRACWRHTRHHGEINGNYGFFLPYLDRLFGTQHL